MVLVESPDGLIWLSREQLRDQVRRDLTGLDLVNDLLADRRTEAAIEDRVSPNADSPTTPPHWEALADGG